MKLSFKITLLIALVTALAMASLPFASVSAQESDPPAAQGQVKDEHLERAWARQLRVYERLGKGFERSDEFVEKLQSWIDRVTENGKDASGVQSALDAFEAAINSAHPIYESANGIVNAHQGFDENGKVTDSEKAKETVKSMGEKLKAIKETMNGTGRALHEAIKDFREANPRPVETPTP